MREVRIKVKITYKEIIKEELDSYKDLILPMVYEELSQQDDMESGYICISTCMDEKPVAAIIADPEDNGDINLLSIWTDQEYRNIGVASQLLGKMLEVALNLYDWDEAQYGDDIILKTMYCLDDKYRVVFEEWLKKNDFTDFCVLKNAIDDTPEVCSASAEVHFYRM